MLKDLGWTRKIKVQKTDGTVINPATEEKQDELKTLLQAIDSNTDGLELKADTINLNTDELEDKVQSVVNTIGEESGNTVLSKLQDLWDKLVSLFDNGQAKVNVWDGSNTVDVVSESGDYKRLAVDIGTPSISVSADDSPTKYQVRTDRDTEITLNTSTDTELFSYTGRGIIEMIAVNSTNSSSWEISIEIDGDERLRIPMSELGNTFGLNNSDYDIAVETANKEFRWKVPQSGFRIGFRILAKATSGTPKVNWFVIYKEHIEE